MKKKAAKKSAKKSPGKFPTEKDLFGMLDLIHSEMVAITDAIRSLNNTIGNAVGPEGFSSLESRVEELNRLANEISKRERAAKDGQRNA